MTPVLAALHQEAPAPLATWMDANLPAIQGALSGIRRPNWTSDEYGSMYVKDGPEWMNFGALVNGKRMMYGWSKTAHRWARGQTPPDAVLYAVHAEGWVELGSMVAASSARSTTEEPPKQDTAPSPTTKHDLPPVSMEKAAIQPGDIVIVHHPTIATFSVSLQTAPRSKTETLPKRMDLAVSVAVRGKRVFKRNTQWTVDHVLKDLPFDPEKPAAVEAPDFTITKLKGDYDAKTQKRTMAIGGYLVRHYLEAVGVPFDRNARVIFADSYWSENGIDVTGDPDFSYVPKPNVKEVEKATGTTPAEGDVTIDHNGMITYQSGPKQYRIVARTWIRDGVRIYEPHGKDELYDELLHIPAPDFTEANLRAWGARLLQKYQNAAIEKVDRVSVEQAYEIYKAAHTDHDGRPHRPVFSLSYKVFSVSYKKPVLWSWVPGTRLLYKPRASSPWEDITAGTNPPSMRLPPITDKALDPEADLNSPATPEKLRASADAMQKTINEKLDPAIGHQNVTRRRSGIVASMRSEAQRMQYVQSALRALANAIEAGAVPTLLQRVNSRPLVENLLQSYITRHPGNIWVGHLEYFLKDTEDAKGLSSERKVVSSFANKHHNRDGVALADMNVLSAIAELCKHKKYHGICINAEAGKRAYRAGIKSDEQWTTAQAQLKHILNEYGVSNELTGDARKKREIEDAERELIGRKIPGYFPTPRALVNHLLELANIQEGMRVLEPSAGKGNIAQQIVEQTGVTPDVVEPVYALRKILEMKGLPLVADNFLEYNPGPIYDRIVMNPPFEDYQDVQHVQHAYLLLKPGGRLVAIMGEGPFFRSDKKGVAWREWFSIHGFEAEKNEPGSFKSSENPTGVATRTVVIDKE